MSRKKGPALYELISSKQSPAMTRSTPVPHEHHREDDDLDRNVLTPGRSVRMSIGTIAVLVTASIVLIVVSYTMGFNKGTAVAREDYKLRLFKELPATAFTEIDQKVVGDSAPVDQTELVEQPTIPATTSWGAIHSDPRVAGNYYFTLIRTTEKGAEQLTNFCRERGLETYVISGNNTQFHRVIALPGLSGPSGTEVEELRSKIHAIGREWARTSAGRGSDLQDAYPSLYK